MEIYTLDPGAFCSTFEASTMPEMTYHTYDHLGNTRVSYQWDATQGLKPLATYEYSPYGRVVQSYQAGVRDRYLSTGHEREAATNYDYRMARLYDAELGRFLGVDVMAGKFPGWSPYNYVLGNPIRFIDPDGREMTDFLDKQGNLVQRINDGSNAVFQQTGSGTGLHYEFTGKYSNQGGINEITSKSITSVIQEQQKLNMLNSSLQQDYDSQKQKYGATHCNQATQCVQLAAQSALRGQGDKTIDLFTPGRANEISQGLMDNDFPVYKAATQSEAELAASEGRLALVAFKNPSCGSGHIATLSVGTNRSRGSLANIGVKSSTGFVPIKGARNAAFRAEHEIKFYIIK